MIKIKGIGNTKFGELWNSSFEDLLIEAIDKALEDANISFQEIDEVYIGTMLSSQGVEQSQVGGILSSVYNTTVPIFRIEGACASGGLAVHQGVKALQSKNANTVLVVGIEKMTDVAHEIISSLLMQAAGKQERLSGITFPGLYAILAQNYKNKFGLTDDELASPAVIAHRNAMKNPLAQFHREVTLDQVRKSTLVAEPLRLLHCSPITDGATAIILSNEDPKENTKEAFILESQVATDTLELSDRESLTEMKSTKIATEKIFEKRDVTQKDIDIIELHDCFSISAIMAIEDIGFVKKGEGGKEFLKLLEKDSKLPHINTSGGLKAGGHPVGATGVKQVAEIALQLRGQAGDRQKENLKYGLTHNLGGSGTTCVINLLFSA